MRLYVDNNATTPVADQVLGAMLPYLREGYGNPASIHQFGQQARAAVEQARAQVAALLNCKPEEIVFTSGGTESDNLAILGVVRAGSGRKRHVITSAIEHHAVLHTCRALERQGVTVSYIPVDATGLVDPDQVRRALRPETSLITIMHANNETGAIEPITEIAEIAREAGVRMHTDAVQSTGKIPVHPQEMGVDLLSLSAHKFSGPKGAGALYVREALALEPMIYGGHNEGEPRPGTENVAGIVGLGAAASLALEEMDSGRVRIRELRDSLEESILSRFEDVGVNGPALRGPESDALRMPNTSNLYFDRVEGESLVIALDLGGVACSTGSACSSGTVEPSHVLMALGHARERAKSSIRFSLGRTHRREDNQFLLEQLTSVVRRLRALSPQTSVAETRS